jgi:hypothetical protein
VGTPGDFWLLARVFGPAIVEWGQNVRNSADCVGVSFMLALLSLGVWVLGKEPAEPSVPRPSSEGRTWAQVATGVNNRAKSSNKYVRTIASSLLR